ncbi:MAG: DUF2191 domain-containing protein [Anaerolineales bacterium]|nr:DUF2191 domain-containing protein [Anaerolineales bacterium]
MRTTIRLDENLLKEAKLLAARRGTTLKSVIEDVMRESLARQHDAKQCEPVQLTTFKGNGLLPGVDLDVSQD